MNGIASVEFDDPLLSTFEGAQLVVRVRAEHIFPNCPRYIHRLPLEALSEYAPGPGIESPEPAWPLAICSTMLRTVSISGFGKVVVSVVQSG